jgi:formate hydrogenlyase subunit 5
MGFSFDNMTTLTSLPEKVASRWQGKIDASIDEQKLTAYLKCDPNQLQELCGWLFSQLGYSFATLVVQENPSEWLFRYIFYGELASGQVHVLVHLPLSQTAIPSISSQIHAADWQEREIEDLFGFDFEGHPRLGNFVLHEERLGGGTPMRASFDASATCPNGKAGSEWRPRTIVDAPGAFMMPIGPVYSDYAESAHFLLETVGEDVIRTIPRFFYKYRGVEKIAERQPIDKVLLLSERFSGTSAFAHSLAFCQAVEEICGIEVPLRAKAVRVLLAELERFRHHVSAISDICSSTAMVVAVSQASILEEELLRLSCTFTGHRFLFGINMPGGLSLDLSDDQCKKISKAIDSILKRLKELQKMLRFSSSFLDRLEAVGMVSREKAMSYGLVGPVARASGVSRDLRKAQPYACYDRVPEFYVPCEKEGDGYARLRILFGEAEASAQIIRQMTSSLPVSPILGSPFDMISGSALGWVEAPRGAAFHWVSIGGDGRVTRYRVMTPSFTNWHGFHIGAEDFAFQDFPIIMASFGLSVTECDR